MSRYQPPLARQWAEPASPASRDGAAVGCVAVTEMRSLGSEIRSNCIRNSCQIKLAEVLQNSQTIAGLTIQLVNAFITYLSQIDSGLK